MIPWMCDALLPKPERYASLKYRRMVYRFDWTRMDYPDACELTAFIRTVGIKHAATIFLWKAAGLRSATRVMQHVGEDSTVDRMVHENRLAEDRETGLAVLAAMRDGGWSRGTPPPVVRLALLDLRDAGFSQPKIAAMTGLTHDQVRTFANGRRERAKAPLIGLIAD